MLLHFKQLTSCPPPGSPGALLARLRSPRKLPPEPTSHLIPGAPKPRKARTARVSLALGVCLICLLLSTNPRAARRLQQPQQRAVRGRVLWEGRRVKECCRRSKRGHRWPDNRECSGLWFAGLFLMELVCWPQN